MHIFLVNDDGIGSKGIMALLKAAIARGHKVTMVAPLTQQSAKSHSFTLTQPLFIADYTLPYENAQAYSVDGSPADCVRIGVRCLVREPVDVLISGINNGYNAGIATHYSGTVGAAMEGVFHHIPSIASSIDNNADTGILERLADYTIQKAEKLAEAHLPHCTILNINAPNYPWIGEVYCPLGESYFQDQYIRRESPRRGSYFWLDVKESQDPFREGTDDDYLRKGYLTLTLIGNFITRDESIYQNLHL